MKTFHFQKLKIKICLKIFMGENSMHIVVYSPTNHEKMLPLIKLKVYPGTALPRTSYSQVKWSALARKLAIHETYNSNSISNK